ncbi:MAG: DsbA family oxidoreductase [Fodinibius sp.]|nr:DsbA family oxidoreductase [Fodinibius sp.]
MKVEIWSDVMCPFCYIGKRRFEMALEQFKHSMISTSSGKASSSIPIWKQIPTRILMTTWPKPKGWSPEQAQQMNQRVTNMAEEVGLTYNMDQAVVANSFDAHRLIQFAKNEGSDSEMEEALFKAYFTDGKNIADYETLVALAVEAGLESGSG